MSSGPDVTVTVKDGGLGLVPLSVSQAVVTMGVCSGATPNVLAAAGDLGTLQAAAGQGPMVESSAVKMAIAGGPQLYMPVNPSQAGSNGAVTHVGPGLGTLTATTAALSPAQQILVKISTGGALGTMQFQIAFGSGAYGTAIVSGTPGPWSYLVPGTLTVLTFATQTYVLNDVYTISTQGVVSISGGGSASWITQASSPLDSYSVVITPVSSGGAGTGSFKFSLDGGNNQSQTTAIPSSGVFVIPNTGVVITFGQHTILITITTPGVLGTAVYSYQVDGGSVVSAQPTTPNSGSNYVVTIPGTGVTLTFAPGTYVNASTYTVNAQTGVITIGGGGINTVTQTSLSFNSTDTYSFSCTTAGYTNTDLTAAFTVLNVQATGFSLVHVVGMGASSSAAATTAAVLDTQATAGFNSYRFYRIVMECPTSESDATILAAFVNFASTRVGVAAGDFNCISPISGRILRRNCAWVAMAVAAAVQPGVDIASVAIDQADVKTVQSLYRDEQAQGFTLDNGRFITMRTYTGLAGYYITNGRLMAAGGSDFTYLVGGRVMDLACQTARPASLPFLMSSARVNPATAANPGAIDERDAQKFDSTVNSKLSAAVVATGNATSTAVQISRTAPFLQTGNEPVSVTVVPLGYIRGLQETFGFSNPALAG